MAKKYSVYDKVTGNFIVDGTANELAERLGVSSNAVRNAATEKYTLAGAYKVAECTELDKKEPTGYAEYESAAANWDAFCEPIRKKYNIPVYKAKPGVRG